MNLKIKNCNECPFLVREYDFETGEEMTYLSCNLLLYQGKQGNLGVMHEETVEKIITPLPECPLRVENLEIELI